MPWPTPQDYNEAIQNPRASFADPELRGGTAELTALGLPRPITGNFASVYRMRCGNRDWAVRCFFREFADLAERYSAISRHLSVARLPYTVGFDFLEHGIKVRGTWYPILKMEWIEGDLLNTFVARHLDNPGQLRGLARSWLQMLGTLDGASIAHGDLQHGNVLVVGNSLKLVDYDGMFVPTLAGRTSHEIGHPNYQHPARTGRHFSPAVDRFSGWVVYLSLLALATERDLWDQLGGGDECLLFRKADFESPDTSRAFEVLAALPEARIRSLTTELQRALERDPLAVPSVVGAREQTPQRKRRSQGALPPVSRVPDWVEQLRPPTPARRFETPRSGARQALGANGLAGIAGLVLWTIMPAPLFLGLGVLGLVADVVLLLVFFGRDPAVAGRRAVIQQARKADRALARLERRSNRYERARRAMNLELEAESARMAEARKALRVRMDTELSCVQGILGHRAESLDGRMGELDRLEREALAQLLATAQERHVHRRLRRARILRSGIRGVAFPVRCRLWMAGVRNAAHVTERAPRLALLSSSQLTAVLLWRVDVESAAKRSMPRAVPEYRSRPISSVSARRRRRLELALVRNRHRESTLRSHIERRYDGKMRALEERLDAQRERILANQSSLDERIEAIRQEEPIQARRLAEAERELEPFRHIRLTTFMRFLLRP